MNVESTSLQQLPNAIMQLSTKISALFFWERRKVRPGIKKVYIIKQLFSVHTLSGKYRENLDSREWQIRGKHYFITAQAPLFTGTAHQSFQHNTLLLFNADPFSEPST